jgi:glycosyltransferase involved in cell wall biosynthesis
VSDVPRPLVTCIVIFWNAERFLAEAIESVRAQTYDAWELVLVDDGSDDGSTAIARRYAASDPGRIRYCEHPGHENRGMSAARNLGIREARGTYVAFLDADDVWLPEKLAAQVAVLEAHPEAAMVYGRTLIWHGWTGRPEDAARDFTYDLGVPPETLVEPPALFFVLLENKVQTPTTCNAMLRRDVVDTLGGFDVRFRGMYEDQVLFAKVELAHPVYVGGACWARYRQHPNSASTAAERGDYHVTRRPFVGWLARYVEEHGFARDPRIRDAVRREWWRCHYPRLHRLIPGVAR